MNSPRRLARSLVALLAALLPALALAGCGSTSGAAATYTPAAYYQTVNGTPDCYFVSTPAEVTDLVNAGLCPQNSVATIMPISWEEEYWSYYSSPSYYNTYMPPSYRTHYTQVTVITFSKTYSKQITTASSKAVYKSSTGGTVKGSTSKLKFGTAPTSGTSGKSGTSKTVHGGGSGTVGSCSLPMVVIQDKSSSSSSHGGGSGSKTATTSTSKTSSGSKGGC